MRISSLLHSFSLLSLTLALGGCAYSTSGSSQDITFLSPDAHDAKCLVYVNKVKYQVWPPQTLNIKKSDKPMLIECHAPGNRDIEIEVPPRIEQKAIWGSPAGMAWDYASQSLYFYPDVIAIDFSQKELKPFMPPKHNNPDIRQPESYDLEEFLPGDPRLNKDKHKKPVELLRRGEANDGWDESEIFPEDEEVITEEPVEELTEEAEAEEIILEEEAVNTEVDAESSVEEISSEASSEPVPLVPGE